MASDIPRIASLGDHPHLIAQVGELRWREWGYGDPDPEAWISVTAQEAGQDQLPITLVAIGANGDAIGAVALGQADDQLNDTERRGRSPWLLGLVVRSETRRQGVGRLLVAELERMAADRGCPQVWVATGKDAVDFYRHCRWVDEESLYLTSSGIRTTILTKRIEPTLR